ncbi:MAG: hypothetical protein KGI69_03950 [Patescibacteria group bacterium]|nr:hypothetical protein [Patescibacteria group bacterium]
MKTTTSTFAKIGVAAGGLLVAAALSVAAQTSGWTSAPSNPPSGNVAAPINVGSSYQVKTGILGLSNLQFLPLQYNPKGGTPNVPVGDVLTAVDNYGTVGWQTLSSVASTSPIPNAIVVFDSSGTWTAPAGVTRIDVKAWGGGGMGGSEDCSMGTGGVTTCNAASGGGAGGFAESIVQVTPGTTYNVTVGAGASASNPTAGNSSFGANTVVANGGGNALNGGNTGYNTIYGYPGSGGSGSGTLVMQGGIGSFGNGSSGSAPTIAFDGHGGTAPFGGRGGVHLNSNGADIADGQVPGGAGGGNRGNGGSGAHGRIVIEY